MISETNNLPDVPVAELTSTGELSGLEVDSSVVDGEIKIPFDPDKIDVTTAKHTVSLLLTRLQEGELLLSPDFQRRANLWDNTRKTRLIESLLLRIPLPSLYVSEDHDGSYTVVDGLQRLCAISHFVDHEILNKAVGATLSPLRLDGLQSLKEHKNKTFEELPRQLQRRINETELTLHVIRAGTPKEVKFYIFSRLNQGGLPLTAQEIRHALYPGVWREHVSALAKSKEFLTATDSKIKTERMGDLELVLRFIALFDLKTNKRPIEQTLDSFLNDTVEKTLPAWAESRWEEASNAFIKAMVLSKDILGNLAFRRYTLNPTSRGPINRGLFEAEAVSLALMDAEAIDKLKLKKEKLVAELGQGINYDPALTNAIAHATGHGASSNIRINTIRNILSKVVSDA